MVLEVVIAYYNNVSWKTFLKDLETYNSEYIVKVYNKCKKKYIANRDYIKVEQLVNIGRESETYLTHIINNYNNLSEYTLFIQDDIGRHVPDNKIFIEYVEKVVEKGNQFKMFPCIWRPGLKPIIRTIHDGCCQLDTLPSSDAIKKMCLHNNVYLPKTYKTETCAFFICHKDIIQKRSLEFYKKLRQWLLSNHKNGYVLEHSWKIIFAE